MCIDRVSEQKFRFKVQIKCKQKGVNKYKADNPGSKLKTAVTTPPSKLKPGSKAANRRKSFCARSRGWTGERGKAARRRWNC